MPMEVISLKLKIIEKLKYLGFSVLSLALATAIWYLVTYLHIFGKLLPSPIAVITELFYIANTPVGGLRLIEHIYWSVRRIMLAFILAASIGVPLGLLMGWYEKIDAIVSPIFKILRPIPPIAWIPLAILWFGIGEIPKVFIIFVGAIVPCITNSYTGIKLTDPTLVDLAKTYEATDRQIFFNIAIPSSLPMIFAGLRHSIGLAWMCLIAAELVAAKEGLGYLILLGMDTANPAMIISGMLIIGCIGGILSVTLRYLEGRLCPWRR
jgi:NitT/TauT family transport system permease protein/sulfonate transport system permease protein